MILIAPIKLARAAAVVALATLLALMATEPTRAQGGISKFQQIGCYYNKPDNNRLWIGAIALDPKYTEQATYDDETFNIIIQAGNLRREIPGSDVLVHPMRTFNYAEASKYQFIKYSLVLDFSSSIPPRVRDGFVKVIDNFLGKLPLAVEGQIIKFSDRVEKFPFTRNPKDLQLQLRQPITYGLTALNDALMESATSLIKEGASTPIRIIILFTDGFENNSTNYKDKQNFLSTFTSLVKSERIAVLAVGVSHEQDRATLKAITNTQEGITGHYIDLPDFDERKFSQAFDQILNWINNTVIFRIPKFGPDSGKAVVSLINKSKAGSISTIQRFDCEY